MSKYQEALDNLYNHKLNKAMNPFVKHENKNALLLQELVDKETPMKPKMVKLFDSEFPTCAVEGCGVGLNPIDSIWHKSTYCGNCGQKIDWSDIK